MDVGIDHGDVEALSAAEAGGSGLGVLDALSCFLNLAFDHVAVGEGGVGRSEGVVGFDGLSNALQGADVHGKEEVEALDEEVGGLG